MADEVVGGGSAVPETGGGQPAGLGTMARDAAAASAPAPSSGGQGTPTGAVAAPVVGAVSQPTGGQSVPVGAAPTPAAFNWREAASKQFGLDFMGYPNDEAAIQALGQRMAQVQQYAQYGQQVMPFFSEFTTWRQQQEAAKAAQQQQQSKVWNAPEWNPAWVNQVMKDAEGNLVSRPGADPTIPSKIDAYNQFRQQFFEKFTANPIEAIKPVMDQYLKAEVEKMVGERLAGVTRGQFVEQTIRENSGWLYEQDANKQIMIDPMTGGKKLSPAGIAYQGYVRQLADSGIADVRKQHEIAVGLTRGYVLEQMQKAGAAPAPGVPQPGVAPVPQPTGGANALQNLGGNAQQTPPADANSGAPRLGQMLKDAMARTGTVAPTQH